MKLYYKSDYKVRETFTTQAGVVIDPRNYTFQIIFKGGKETTFTCSYDKDTEEYVNCVYDSVNNAILCLLDNHGLKKGILQRELLIEEPDTDFDDDKLDYITLKCLDIELVDTCEGESIYDIYDDEIIITDITAGKLAAVIHSATLKDDIIDADELNYLDSEDSFALVKTTWLNIKAKLKAYFDTIYASITHNHNLNDLTEKSYNSLTDTPSLNFEPANENIQSHIGDEDIHVTSEEKSTWSGKQDALTFSTDIETDKASTTKISAIKTFYDWAVGKFIDITKIVTTWTATTLYTNIPSEKLVKDSLNLKADISPANGSTSALRALFIARGYYKETNTYYCVYNSTTGYYEMNGLTDLTESQMAYIYVNTAVQINIGLPFNSPFTNMSYSNIRTSFPRTTKNGYDTTTDQNRFRLCDKLEVYKNYGSFGHISCSVISMFYGCSELRVVDFLYLTSITNATYVADCFYGCEKLVTAYIKYLKVDFSFASSPLLSLASLQYLVTNRANGTTRITITVHPTVWGYLNDAVNHSEWNALLVDAVATKFIDFASA